MADFIVRSALRDDFPAIRTLIHAVHINPTGLKWRRFLVAVTVNGTLIGCGQIKPHAGGSKELASLAVQERARGQGVARALMLELLRQEATRPLYLMCRAGLRPMYEKFGFRPALTEEMPPYFQKISRLEGFINRKGVPTDRLLIMRLD